MPENDEELQELLKCKKKFYSLKRKRRDIFKIDFDAQEATEEERDEPPTKRNSNLNDQILMKLLYELILV